MGDKSATAYKSYIQRHGNSLRLDRGVGAGKRAPGMASQASKNRERRLARFVSSVQAERCWTRTDDTELWGNSDLMPTSEVVVQQAQQHQVDPVGRPLRRSVSMCSDGACCVRVACEHAYSRVTGNERARQQDAQAMS